MNPLHKHDGWNALSKEIVNAFEKQEPSLRYLNRLCEHGKSVISLEKHVTRRKLKSVSRELKKVQNKLKRIDKGLQEDLRKIRIYDDKIKVVSDDGYAATIKEMMK